VTWPIPYGPGTLLMHDDDSKRLRMVTVHRTTTEEIAQLAAPPDKPRSPYDDLLDAVAQGQPMRVESADPKDLRGAKVSISRLAKRRGVPITYQALTNGFAVLLDETANTPKIGQARRRRTRQPDCKASKSLRRTSECVRRKRHSACANPHHTPSRRGDVSSFTLTCPSLGTPSPQTTRTPSVWIGARTLTFLTDRRRHSDVSGARTLTFRGVLSVSVAHAL